MSDISVKSNYRYIRRNRYFHPWVQSGIGDKGWTIHTDGGLRYKGKIVVPRLAIFREEILKEFHYSHFSIRPGGTKMYHDLHSSIAGVE